MEGEFKTAIIEKITLRIVHGAVKKNNFVVLKMLPSTINEIMKETGLAKVPANQRVNELERLCLVERRRGTGEVKLTEYGELIVKIITKIQDAAAVNVKKLLNEEEK